MVKYDLVNDSSVMGYIITPRFECKILIIIMPLLPLIETKDRILMFRSVWLRLPGGMVKKCGECNNHPMVNELASYKV